MLFTLILGSQWTAAGKYAALIAPWIFTSFILPPSNAVLLIYRKNHVRLFLQVFGTICKISSFFVGFQLFQKPEAVILIYSLTSAAVNIVVLGVAFSYTGNANPAIIPEDY